MRWVLVVVCLCFLLPLCDAFGGTGGSRRSSRSRRRSSRGTTPAPALPTPPSPAAFPPPPGAGPGPFGGPPPAQGPPPPGLNAFQGQFAFPNPMAFQLRFNAMLQQQAALRAAAPKVAQTQGGPPKPNPLPNMQAQGYRGHMPIRTPYQMTPQWGGNYRGAFNYGHYRAPTNYWNMNQYRFRPSYNPGYRSWYQPPPPPAPRPTPMQQVRNSNTNQQQPNQQQEFNPFLASFLFEI